MKYIPADKLIAEIEKLKEEARKNALIARDSDNTPVCALWAGKQRICTELLSIISSLQQEKPEENKLPNKRTRVNYAICNLQSFKPLREAIVLDDYVYDEGKCYRENLLNYIHAIPENRLTEIRSYLKEKGRWPYDDDTDWIEKEQPNVDLEKEITPSLVENMLCEFGVQSIDDMDSENLAEFARYFWNKGYIAGTEGTK